MNYDNIVEVFKKYNIEDPYEKAREFNNKFKQNLSDVDYLYTESLSLEETEIILRENFLENSIDSITNLIGSSPATGFLLIIMTIISGTMISDHILNFIKNQLNKIDNYIKKLNLYLGNQEVNSTFDKGVSVFAAIPKTYMNAAHVMRPGEKIANTLITKNYSNCLEKSGISLEDINFVKNFISEIPDLKKYDIDTLIKKIFNVSKPEDRKKIDMSKIDDIKKKAKSLINCFLDYATSLHAELFASYQNCLNLTGANGSQINSLNSLSLYPVDTKCKAVYDQIQIVNNDFKEVLEVFFKDDAQSIHEWNKILDEKIKNSRYNKFTPANIPFAGKNDKPKFINV